MIGKTSLNVLLTLFIFIVMFTCSQETPVVTK